MKLYKCCKHCKNGAGYIVISVSNGVENTIPCYTCKGEGYVFIKEIDVDKTSMGPGYARISY